MGEWALAVGVVVVALIARDVVLRVVNGRAKAADVAQVAAALEGETVRLSETRAELEQLTRNFTRYQETMGERLGPIITDIQVLKTTSSLRGPR